MSRLVVEALRPLHPIRVENLVHPGTPDINYTGGWIELKEASHWPRAPWHLRLPHFTVQQKVWLRRRRSHGGCAYLLLKVGAEWLLLPGERAADLLGESSREDLVAAAAMTWRSSDQDWGERLVRFLEQG